MQLDYMFFAIVPAYNEEKTIGPVVRGLLASVDLALVVDDGSSDRTEAIARAAGAVVLRHKINRGQGAALETGHEYARRAGADYVLHFDADGQFDIGDIASALFTLKKENADILLGSRFLDGRSRVPWFKERIMFPLARLFHRLAFGIILTDAHNGFRILNRRALEVIRITHDRMAHATELVRLAADADFRMIEFPVRVVYREYGQGALGGLRALSELAFGRFVKKAIGDG